MASKTLFKVCVGIGSRLLRKFDLIEDAKALGCQLSENGLFEDEFESVTSKVVRIIHCPGCVTVGVTIALHVVDHKTPEYLGEVVQFVTQEVVEELKQQNQEEESTTEEATLSEQ